MAVALTASPYDRAVAAIDAVSWRGIKPGLERTEALLAALGDPHSALRGVLVAGTNGKGSVCALVDSVLRAARVRSVLLTKPHLLSYRERMVADGVQVSEESFAALIDEVSNAAARLPADLQPTGFELLTVAGVLFAAREDAGAVVCEVGMGGRLDSTNVLDLGIAVVTNVDLDHTEHLGATVEAIAREKAAIIKPGNRVITAAGGVAVEVVRERCRDAGATLTVVDAGALAGAEDADRHGVHVDAVFAGHTVRVHAPLLGGHQLVNVAVAVAVCDALRESGHAIDEDAVLRGCENVRWPGRMQWIDSTPPLLLDAAHNPAGMTALAGSLPSVAAGRRPVVAVFAAMRDKDVAGMAAALQDAGDITVITTTPDVQRAAPAGDLAAWFTPAARALPRVRDALDAARELAGPGGLVLVCGSLFLVGEALRLLGEEQRA